MTTTAAARTKIAAAHNACRPYYPCNKDTEDDGDATNANDEDDNAAAEEDAPTLPTMTTMATATAEPTIRAVSPNYNPPKPEALDTTLPSDRHCIYTPLQPQPKHTLKPNPNETNTSNHYTHTPL